MKKVILENVRPDIADVEVPELQAQKMINMGSGWTLKEGQTLDDGINDNADSGDTQSAAEQEQDCGCSGSRTTAKTTRTSKSKKATKSSSK